MGGRGVGFCVVLVGMCVEWMGCGAWFTVLHLYIYVSWFLVFCGAGSVARLVATMGTSPGVVYEALLNVCRGRYDAPYSPAVPVDTVVMVHTSAPGVVRAAGIARLLIYCSHAVFPEGDPRRLPCWVESVGLAPVDVEDVDTGKAYEVYYNSIQRHIGQGEIVDVAAARAAIGQPGDDHHHHRRALGRCGRAQRAPELQPRHGAREGPPRGLQRAQRVPGLPEALGRLVTGEARTIVLYP